MCIICAYPEGYPKNTETVRNAMISGLESNSQSFGYFYKRKNEKKVVYEKGFTNMSAREVVNKIMDLKLKDEDILVVHGRIPTDGDRSDEQAHPFVMTTDLKKLTSVSGEETEHPLMCHNGVFKIKSKDHPSFSDTCAFAYLFGSLKSVQALLKKNPDKVKELFSSKEYAGTDIWGWGRIAVVFPDLHKLILVGEFIKDTHGIYSNSGYKTRRTDYGGSTFNNHGSKPRGLLPTTTVAGFRTTKDEEDDAKVINLFGPDKIKIRLTDADDDGIGGSDKFFELFRYPVFDKSMYYSNHMVIPNLFNYWLLAVRLRKELASLENTALVYPLTAKTYCDITYLDSGGVKILVNDPLEDVTGSLHTLHNLKSILEVCEINYSSIEGPKEKGTGLTFAARFVNDYENLVLSSTLESDGGISKSYAKRILKVLESKIETINFDTEGNPCKPQEAAFSMRGFDINKNYIKKFRTNAGDTLLDIEPYALFVFYVERTYPFTDCNFTKTQIDTIIQTIKLQTGGDLDPKQLGNKPLVDAQTSLAL